jgi:hypothetical protein
MDLEDRIRSSVETSLDELTARLDADVRTLVERLVTVALEERDEALAVARRDTRDEATADLQRQIEEAEARVRLTIDEAVNEARTDERAKTTAEVRHLAEVETAQQVSDALAEADAQFKSVLADAEAAAEQRLLENLVEARVREREAGLAALTRLLENVRGLDGATTLSEVLDALGQAAGREASRAAVFVVRNDRLLGWKLAGFGTMDTQPKSLDLGLTESGVVGLAVGTSRPVATRDGPNGAAGPGFAQLPADRTGLAVPVIVGGRVVAVVYADSLTIDARDHVVPNGWPEVIEILARHAARCLEALTVQKAASSATPRFWVSGAGRTSPASDSAAAKLAQSPSPPGSPPPGVLT